MSRLESVLADVLRNLTGEGAHFALVGGLAVSVRTQPRFTRDLDLAIAVDNDQQAEALVQRLGTSGYVVAAVVEHEAKQRLATVRLRSPKETGQGIVADLLFASSGIESEVVSHAQPLEVFPGVVVPVARIGHLIALKLLSRDDANRPQDAVDLAALVAVADAAEIDVARAAVALIETRGFARGRDLLAALATWGADRR